MRYSMYVCTANFGSVVFCFEYMYQNPKPPRSSPSPTMVTTTDEQSSASMQKTILAPSSVPECDAPRSPASKLLEDSVTHRKTFDLLRKHGLIPPDNYTSLVFDMRDIGHPVVASRSDDSTVAGGQPSTSPKHTSPATTAERYPTAAKKAWSPEGEDERTGDKSSPGRNVNDAFDVDAFSAGHIHSSTGEPAAGSFGNLRFGNSPKEPISVTIQRELRELQVLNRRPSRSLDDPDDSTFT